MIVTVLIITKKLFELIKKHFPRLKNTDTLCIQLIEESFDSNQLSVTDSTVVFSNCETLKWIDLPLNDNNNNNNNVECERKRNDKFNGFSWQKKKALLTREKESVGLTFRKKMECDAGTNRVSFGGMSMSPRKTPITQRGMLSPPESDCNSNNLTVFNDMPVYCINEKMQDCQESFQDNSEYQWFLDYGYKDNTQQCQSVFSILSTHDMLYYDDLARDLDANLAEVDMDDFHREDIHSILSTLPNMCNSEIQGVEEREMFASVSESMMVKFGFDNSSPHTSSQEENSNSISMCKSELLFSPVRESYLPNANLSVDSLDLSENEINLLITCQANKNNYTIAFEGSTVMGSDDSVCHDPDSSCHKPRPSDKSNTSSNVSNSMSRSESSYTTWSKIKQRSSDHLQLRRQSSGNNNPPASAPDEDARTSNTIKSLSLPNLFRQKQKQKLSMSISSRFSSDLSSPIDSEQRCIKLYDIHKSNNTDVCGDHLTSSVGGNSQDRPHNFNLVRLFMKQKSASHEGMCNYISDRALYSSYCEESNYINSRNSKLDDKKKDCVCHNSIRKVGTGKPLKNNWTQEDKKTQDCSVSGFEDSLVTRNAQKSTQIEKENSDSESVEQITESLKHASESVEQITGSCNNPEQFSENTLGESSHAKRRADTKSACLFNVNNNNSVLDNRKLKYCSDESTQENGSNTESAENMTCDCFKKNGKMEKSIQTSKLLENDEKQVKVPAYILYPNYSLPNLEFLKEKHYVHNIDFTKIFLRPQTFKEPEVVSPKKRTKTSGIGKRPLSVNDIETLKKTGFKHVRDWDSLTFLLPREYKEFLHEIPEIVAQLKDIKSAKEDLKPLFSLNTAPSRKVRKRPISCDSNFFDFRSSNFSSTATQPSSGYRGSSTMLNSNASAMPSPRNPTHAFKYDSNDSVFNSSRKNTPPKSGSLLNSEEDDSRPHLPRSILRNNSMDNPKYTCKTQKDNANKRYSMIEFHEKNMDSPENKVNRRRSTQDPYYLKSPQKKESVKECRSNEKEEDGLSSVLESDMRRLEELLEISAVFGESVESFTERDMLKLRSQVSKFLTMQKNLQKVSECLQTVNESVSNGSKVDEDMLYKEKHSQTPNNTPEHKKKLCLTIAGDGYDNEIDTSCSNCDGEECHRCRESGNYREDTLRGLKKTVSFAEKISFLTKDKEQRVKDATPPNSPIVASLQSGNKTYPGKVLKLLDTPICEESYEGSPCDSPKRNVESNSSLTHKKDLILDVKKAVVKIIEQLRMKSEKTQEEVSSICLHHLCPSLYAVLSDGLKEEIETPFGAIRNSVWNVIEASSQQGPLTETLNHLVQRLNRDDILTEGLVKFNAFIFGLLNANSLDAWLSYLRTRDGLLHKYYHSKGLIISSNSAGAPIRILMDQLIQIIHPLSELRFSLDLMYQVKLLHSSLQNINCLLEATNNDLLSPAKQLILLKLVQSIQNSINQPSDGRKEESQKSEKSQRSGSKPRPRSGCDILSADNSSDVASSAKKRWSGVQLNSKLLQAFERLGEETESEYTDSLDNARGNKGGQSPSSRNIPKRLQNSDDTIDEVSSAWNNDSDSCENKTKEQKKSILSNLNKKNVNNRLAEFKTDCVEQTKGNSQNVNGGHKFKRLQQKWEKLSGYDRSSGSNTPSQGLSPAHRSKLPTPKYTTPEKPNYEGTNTLTSPTTRVSRIPRPVSSPVQTTPTTDKGTLKKINPSVGIVQSKIKQIPAKTERTRRISRADVDSNSDAMKNRAIRPSSLPYTGASTLPFRKAPQTRASSMSLNRRPEKKSQPIPRVVRTLTHRLPSDSGHLSFNEGEKLKVVLEVDETWFLCCRGTQKGLVPKSAVLPVPEHVRY